MLISFPRGVRFAEWSLALGSFALGTGEFVSMGLLPEVAHDLQVSIPAAGHMISAYAVGVVVGAPLLTVIFARARRRQLLIGLMVMLALGNVASAVVPNFTSMALARLFAGLPHGAYFGIASLVAVSLVAADKRAQAVGRLMLGLSVANVVGVPFATLIGQTLGWRTTYLAIAAISLLTALLVRIFVPDSPADKDASPLRELGALGRVQVWLALGVGAIGFGGLFAVYSYIAPTLTMVTRTTASAIPVFLSIIGLGMVAGNLVGGWLADRSVVRALVSFLVWTVAVMILFVLAAPHVIATAIVAFMLGSIVAIAPALQTRLMDVAGDAQALAAALNHSAFNLANALGAWLGGVTIAAGLGWTSTGWVGAALATAGLVVLSYSIAIERREHRRIEARAFET